MIKRILVALDTDVDTQVATIYGMKLANKFNASVTGLAIIDSPQIAAEISGGGAAGLMYYNEDYKNFMSEETRKEAGNLLSAFEETVSKAGVKHGEVMEEGVPYERIIEDMKYHDLLIIGRNPHFFYNKPDKETQTLAKIIKKGNVPSLVVTESYREVKSALIAYDGSTSAARAIQWFAQLQPYGNKLAIELVNVNKKNTQRSRDEANLLLRLSQDFLKAHEFENITKTILDHDTPGEALLSHQKKTSSDLIVLGAHSMSAIRRMTLGSTTHYLVKRSEVPLFMCH